MNLYLSNSAFTRLPEEIAGLVSLQNLYLSGCPIVTLPDSLQDLPQLREIALYNCPITAEEVQRWRALLPSVTILSDF